MYSAHESLIISPSPLGSLTSIATLTQTFAPSASSYCVSPSTGSPYICNTESFPPSLLQIHSLTSPTGFRFRSSAGVPPPEDPLPGSSP